MFGIFGLYKQMDDLESELCDLSKSIKSEVRIMSEEAEFDKACFDATFNCWADEKTEDNICPKCNEKMTTWKEPSIAVIRIFKECECGHKEETFV